jgi:steroid 5-alpha reductase family enzyme
VSFFQLLITALGLSATLAAIMALAWHIQRTSGNSGWVDVTWSLGVGGVAFVAAAWPGELGWPHWRQIAVAAFAALWCLRLGLHVARRTMVAGDDPRYRDLIVRWGSHAPRRMFWFLQAQAAVGTVLALSIVLAAQNPNPALRLQDLVGFIVLAIAVVGEATADRQLRTFKAESENQNRICDIGLWRWSRHPNYFFEWLGWCAYPVIAIDLAGHNPYGWLALAAPVCMYWVLVYASGIPPLEAHMLRRHGETFRAYQRRTPAFFPLPPEP